MDQFHAHAPWVQFIIWRIVLPGSLDYGPVSCACAVGSVNNMADCIAWKFGFWTSFMRMRRGFSL